MDFVTISPFLLHPQVCGMLLHGCGRCDAGRPDLDSSQRLSYETGAAASASAVVERRPAPADLSQCQQLQSSSMETVRAVLYQIILDYITAQLTTFFAPVRHLWTRRRPVWKRGNVLAPPGRRFDRQEALKRNTESHRDPLWFYASDSSFIQKKKKKLNSSVSIVMIFFFCLRNGELHICGSFWTMMHCYITVHQKLLQPNPSRQLNVLQGY